MISNFIIKKIAINLLVFVLFVLSPVFFVFAQGPGVPPTGSSGGGTAPAPVLIVCDGPNCTFNSLLLLVERVITFLIYISIPLASISFAWAGFLLIFSGGSEQKKNEAKSIFTKTAIGFIIVLSAWLIIYFISKALLYDEAILLQPSS